MRLLSAIRTVSITAFASIIALSGGARGEWRADAIAALPDSGETYLGLFNDGARDGFMRLGWVKEADQLLMYDRSMLPSLELYETQETGVSIPDLTPKFVNLRFHQGSAIHQMEVSFPDETVQGERRSARPGQEDRVTQVNIEDLPSDTTLRIISFILPLVLSQEEGASVGYHWYAPLGNTVDEVTLTARDGGEIDTPAGKFDTSLFELRGGSPENDIYVSRGKEPRIVRIDALGQPFQFLALPAPEEH